MTSDEEPSAFLRGAMVRYADSGVTETSSVDELLRAADRARDGRRRRSLLIGASGAGALLAAVALSVAALSGIGEQAASPATAPGSPRAELLEAVSLSSPGEAAARALMACGIVDPQHHIAGMALIPRGRDVPRYVRLSGNEPEIQTDDAVWVIVWDGPRQSWSRGGVPPLTMVDPTCIVTPATGESAVATWIATGPLVYPDGTVETPPAVPTPAEELPTPAP